LSPLGPITQAFGLGFRRVGPSGLRLVLTILLAAFLHLLGFDHTKLTFRFQGRDFRLTDVHGQVVEKLVGRTATD
jgi:hypothetical protein